MLKSFLFSWLLYLAFIGVLPMLSAQTNARDSLRQRVAALPFGKEKAATYNKLSIAYLQIDPVQANLYAMQALQVSLKTKDVTEETEALLNISSNKIQVGEYTIALQYAQTALQKAIKQGNLRQEGLSYTRIGAVYLKVYPKSDSAKTYYRRAIRIFEKTSLTNLLWKAYSNYGITCLNAHLPDSALIYYDKCEKLSANGHFELIDFAFLWNNIGQTYMAKTNIRQALLYFNKSLVIKRKIGATTSLPSTLGNLAICYLNNNQVDSALICLNEARAIAIQTQQKGNIEEMYELYAQIYERKKEYQKSLFYLKKYKKYTDSIQSDQTLRAVMQATTQVQIAHKQQENAILTQLHRSDTARLALQKYLIIISLIAMLIVGTLCFFIFKQYRITQRLNADLAQRVAARTEEIVQKNKQLAVYIDDNSHKLRAPVATIMGLAQILNDYPLTEQEREGYYTRLLKSVQQLDLVVQNINAHLHGETPTQTDNKPPRDSDS